MSIGRHPHVALSCFVTALWLGLPVGLTAHDIPSDALVQMFVKPSGTELRLVVRLPLSSLLNINLPKRGEEYLDFVYIESGLHDAATATADAMDLYEHGRKLAPPRIAEVRVSLPSDRSFASYETALAHVQGARLPVDTELVWNQGFFDALLTYDIQSDRSDFAVHPYFGALAPHVLTALRFLPPNRPLRAFDLNDNPGLVHLDPRWYQAASAFVMSGFLHALGRMDLLLFLLSLAIPIRRIRKLVPIVAAFSLAYAASLIASGWQIAPSGAWFAPVMGTVIAASIILTALDNILWVDLQHRWVMAFGFGLAYGFGSSLAVRPTLQLAGAHLLISLAAFDLGAAIGQLCVLALFLTALAAFFQYVTAERVGVVVLSALVCHTGWIWLRDRVAVLTVLAWPLADLIEVARWASAVAITASIAVFLQALVRRRLRFDPREAEILEATRHGSHLMTRQYLSPGTPDTSSK